MGFGTSMVQTHQQTERKSQVTYSTLINVSPPSIADSHLQMKVSDWCSWAYTDGSCLTSFSPQRIGAGVYIPSSNKTLYVNSGGIGMINTINRAELTGIAAALAAECTHIATDSACSLSQIRKQLLYPESQRKHPHAKLLENIASLVERSETPIHFYKVKAHADIIGNECADAIAKHAALHEHGHDVTIPPPTADGNPFSHMYWIAAEEPDARSTPRTTRLVPLQNIKDQLKHHMDTQHRLGDADTTGIFYQSWMKMLNVVDTKTSNSFWNNPKITSKQKLKVMQYRTGTLHNQKIAFRNGNASSPNCQLCQGHDSQIHMLSGCQHETTKNMATDRHNIAARHIVEAISKGDYGGNIIFTDIGSDAKLMEQNLARPEQTANKTLPSWFLPNLSATDLQRSSRPDAIIVLPIGRDTHPAHVRSLPPSNWDVHLIEVKYCDDTRTDSQLLKATEQHQRLVNILKAQRCGKVSLHIILLGVVGTIYKYHTETPLSKLGLEYCKVKKLTHDLNTHSIQYADKIIRTKRKLGFRHANGVSGVSSRNPPDPH